MAAHVHHPRPPTQRELDILALTATMGLVLLSGAADPSGPGHHACEALSQASQITLEPLAAEMETWVRSLNGKTWPVGGLTLCLGELADDSGCDVHVRLWSPPIFLRPSSVSAIQ